MSMQFEDLEAWKQARLLTKTVYEMTSLPLLKKDFRLCSQIQAASVSVMSSIAEGYGRTGKAEKLHFYNIARSPCGEVRSQLYVIEDVYTRASASAQQIREQAVSTGRLISGLIASTEKR